MAGRRLALAVALWTAAMAAPHLRPSPPLPQPAVSTDSASAATLLRLANAERGEAGVAALASRSDVVGMAQDWSERMAMAGAISHNDAFFASKGRLGAKALGENVGVSGTAEDMHTRLMASASHRANILDPRFTVVGVGAARIEGQVYATQGFVQPAGAGSPQGGLAAPTIPRPAGTAPPTALPPKSATTGRAPSTTTPAEPPSTSTTRTTEPVIPSTSAPEAPRSPQEGRQWPWAWIGAGAVVAALLGLLRWELDRRAS